MEPFYLGLSCLSNEEGEAPYAGASSVRKRPCGVSGYPLNEGSAPVTPPGPDAVTPPGPDAGSGRALHTEARRVLGLLDAEEPGRARDPSGRTPGRPAAIAAESGGRPFFADRHADFNISHSRRIAAVAWSEAVNPVNGLPFRVGCDVQHVSPGKSREAVARKYYSPGENSYIGAAGDSAASAAERERIGRFYRIWVLKECYLKAKGLSVLDMRTSPSFADRDGLVQEAPVPFGFFLYELGGDTGDRYLLAVCRETAGFPAAAPPPEIRWFSPALVVKHIAVIGAGLPYN